MYQISEYLFFSDSSAESWFRQFPTCPLSESQLYLIKGCIRFQSICFFLIHLLNPGSDNYHHLFPTLLLPIILPALLAHVTRKNIYAQLRKQRIIIFLFYFYSMQVSVLRSYTSSNFIRSSLLMGVYPSLIRMLTIPSKFSLKSGCIKFVGIKMTVL